MERCDVQAQFARSRFNPGGPSPFTPDEEHSGIIDASSILGKGWFLGDTQAHYTNPDQELVEGGQMWALKLPSSTRGGDRDYANDDNHGHGHGGDRRN